MSEHLSKEQILEYRLRLAPPERLILADDHLSSCAECRERMMAAGEWTSAFQNPGADKQDQFATQHLPYEQLEQLVDQKLGPKEQEILRAHLANCSVCAREFQDLQVFQAELNAETSKPVPIKVDSRRGRVTGTIFPWATPLRIALVAASLLIVIAVVRIRMNRPPDHASNQQPPDGANQLAVINELPSNEQALVREAIEKGNISYPAELGGLQGKSETLLGPPEQPGFHVLEPQGEVVFDSRPVFRWQPLTGAGSYTVSIFDAALNAVQTSPRISKGTTEWQVSRPLQRGRVYQWQVNAMMADGSLVTAPKPPSPEAKFRVLDQARADELEHFRDAHPDTHVVMGILYAQAGILRIGEQELDKVLPGASDYELAQSLLKSIRRIRESGR